MDFYLLIVIHHQPSSDDDRGTVKWELVDVEDISHRKVVVFSITFNEDDNDVRKEDRR